MIVACFAVALIASVVTYLAPPRWDTGAALVTVTVTMLGLMLALLGYGA